MQENQTILISQGGSVLRTVRSQTKSQRQSQRQLLKTAQGSMLASGAKLFETPTYTHVDKFIEKMIQSPDMQTKLSKMKHHYTESQLFNPQYTFKREDLKKMKKLDILKTLANHESLPNLIHVANNCNKKIPVTSLNLKFNSKQQYFSFDDPKEKEEIMKLYNMRARVKEQAKISQKQQSLSSQYLSQLKQKKQSLPKVIDPYYDEKKDNNPKKHGQARVDFKISQKEADLPRNLVTNSIMSRQRRGFLEKTLYVNKNIKNELRENIEKMHRKLDNIYFEDFEVAVSLPTYKLSKVATKISTNVLSPQQKLLKLFGHLSSQSLTAQKKSEIDEYLESMSPQQDQNIALFDDNQGRRSTQTNIVDMLEQNRDLNRLATKYFSKGLDLVDQNSIEDSDSLQTENSVEMTKKVDNMNEEEANDSQTNSFINKIEKINAKKVKDGDQLQQRPYLLSQYIQQKEEQKVDGNQNTEDSREEFAKSRLKPKKEMEAGLIIKERSLPQHKMIRRKAMSILKYNFNY